MEAIVAERGQITLPKAVRDALGLTKGTMLTRGTGRRTHHPAQGRERGAVAKCAGKFKLVDGLRPPTRPCARFVAARPATRWTGSTMIAIDSSVLDRHADRRPGARRGVAGVHRGRAGHRRRRGLRGRRGRGAGHARHLGQPDGHAGRARRALRAHHRGFGHACRRHATSASVHAAASANAWWPTSWSGHTPCFNASALITRDGGFFRDYFKGLKVIVPKAS